MERVMKKYLCIYMLNYDLQQPETNIALICL